MIGKRFIVGRGDTASAALGALLVEASAPNQASSVLAINAINSPGHCEDLLPFRKFSISRPTMFDTIDIPPKASEMVETERQLPQRGAVILRTFIKRERL